MEKQSSLNNVLYTFRIVERLSSGQKHPSEQVGDNELRRERI